MDRILTLTLNPAIDKTYIVEMFEKGKMKRISDVIQYPGGKGLNVLRVLNKLGYPAMGSGFLGGYSGKWIIDQLNKENLQNNFFWISGETRTTLTIIETGVSSTTELLEGGPVILDEEAKQFLKTIEQLCAKFSFVTISGSLAKGLPIDYYAKIAGSIGKSNAKACVDTSGEALRSVLKSHPYLIKINDKEFSDWVGSEVITQEQIINGIQRLRDAGCEIAVITFGAQGSYACSKDGVWFLTTPKIDVVNAVGSGDSFFAGLVGGLAENLPISEALALASAAGASNAKHQGAGQIDPHEIPNLIKEIKLTKLK